MRGALGSSLFCPLQMAIKNIDIEPSDCQGSQKVQD